MSSSHELARDVVRLETWTRTHAPGAFRVLPPAEPARVAALAAHLGLVLPTELVELLAISEGGLSLRTDDPDAAWELSNIDRMFADWTMFGEIGVGWNRAWIPFANDGGGDWLCLDTAGQVLFHSPGAANRLVCRSLSALFATFLDGLAHGEYRYEPFVGIERARPR